MEDRKQPDILSAIQNDIIEILDPSYQNKFIKVFIEDKQEWSSQIYDVIFPEYFDGYQKMIINYELEYYRKYRIPADYDELRDIAAKKEKDPLLLEHINATIEKIRTLELHIKKVQAVKDMAYEFFKSKIMKNVLWELVNDCKHQTYDSMKVKLENGLKAGEPKSLGHDYFDDVEKRLKKDYRNPIPALVGLDERMGGGLSSGELGVVFAPTGGGKSMALVRFTVSALLAGKKVVYYTMELSDIAIGQRIDACLNSLNIKDIYSFPHVIREKIKQLRRTKAGLIIKKYPMGKASVDTLYADLQSLEINKNFKPDIIFIDYADKMKAITTYNDRRHTLTDIYDSIRAMADELNLPIWTCSQVNRLGYDKENYGLDVVAEAIGKAETCDVAIAIAGTPEQRRAKKAKIGFLKNRNGEIGVFMDFIFNTWTVDIRLDPDSEKNISNGQIILPSSGDGVKSATDYMSTIQKHNSNLQK